ncbi:RxLR effector protein [Phytophthora megakarya]|uniref:RxLR effector protein n=1 Tax=Phytophthora megakarya TaxID=4795 RepID=A0A225WE45_9STRA|nr:RxLR effector protein [Phytophthora megakarya]
MRGSKFLVLLTLSVVITDSILADRVNYTAISDFNNVGPKFKHTEGGITEERTFPSLNRIHNYFKKVTNVGTSTKSQHEIAVKLASPKVGQVFMELRNQPRFRRWFMNNSVLKRLRIAFNGGPTQFTSTQVKNVGRIAVTSNSPSIIQRLLITYGTALLIALGILFILYGVYKVLFWY